MIHEVSLKLEEIKGREARYRFSYKVKLPEGEFHEVSYSIAWQNCTASITQLLENVVGLIKASKSPLRKVRFPQFPPI